MRKNTNKPITNLPDIELSDDKIAVLKSSLKHELFIGPDKHVMFAVMEDIYN